MVSIILLRDKLSRPLSIGFEPSGYCNYRCEMCPAASNSRDKGFMSLADYRKVIDRARPLFVTLGGDGEPLMNKDIIHFVSYAKSHSSTVKLITNGYFLNEEITKGILEYRLDNISPSIASVDKENYEKIRKGGDFERVVSNLKDLLRRRKESRARTHVVVNMTLSTSNITELPDAISFFGKMGVDLIDFLYVFRITEENRKLVPDSDIAESSIVEAKKTF